MSLLSNAIAIPQKGGYTLTNSLRFRRSASARLTRTFASTGTNNKIQTFSAWVKRGNLSGAGTYRLMGGYDGSSTNSTEINFVNDQLRIEFGGSASNSLVTTGRYRDPSAWYHIVVAIDTTQATNSNRIKMYVNGSQITAFDTANYPAQNAVSQLTSANANNSVGAGWGGFDYFDGYMTEVNFVDGQALTPSDFGETDSITGVWKPKRYTGSYGTNGFYLPMKETTQASGFNTVTYTGNGTAQSITGVGFQPDLVWLKFRSSIGNNELFDSVRGAGKNIVSNLTVVESTATNKHSSFDSDGFSVGSALSTNTNGGSHVAWCWEAGGAASSNTNGTITSSVSANTAKGFSIVSYTGTGADGTVGHGLGSTPEMVIVKNRDVTSDWRVWHTGLSGSNYYVSLNLTDAEATSTGLFGTHTSSVISLKNGFTTNGSGNAMVAYCFSEVSGFSKFGSYTGTGSSGNAITGLGFRPAWIMYKRTDATSNWTIHDITRDPSNEGTKRLYPHLNNVEQTVTGDITFDSDGFTLDGTGGDSNAASGTYIYMAFADTRDYQFNFDASGNKNNWTPVNINSNASSETTYDIMSDVPTLTDEDTGNFCTLNPNWGNATLSNGNLSFVTNSLDSNQQGTIAVDTGKWYYECTLGTYTGGVVSNIGYTTAYGRGTGNYGNMSATYFPHGMFYRSNGAVAATGYSAITGATYTTGDTIGLAYDADNNTFTAYKNGVSQGTHTGLTDVPYTPTVGDGDSTWYYAGDVNFGQRPFKYTPPTGYKAINTYNLPDSAIKDGSQYFDVDAYSGTTSAQYDTQSRSSLSFSPDLVWIKSRSDAVDHTLVDSVTGTGKYLSSNTTTAQTTDATGYASVYSFDTNGWTMEYNGRTSMTGRTYVGWAWRASDSAPVSNTDGSITSTVSANPTAGFAIATYTGTGNVDTVGHGLTVEPEFILVKDRDAATNWIAYTKVFDGSNDYFFLNSTGAAGSSGFSGATSTIFNFNVGASPYSNTAGRKYVMYSFKSIEGYSKIGTWETVNVGGTPAAGFVYTGFKPRFIIWKAADTSNSYTSFGMQDTERTTYNGDSETLHTLWANANYAEGARGNGSSSGALGANGFQIDFLSNGLYVRGGGNSELASSGTYFYMAFAENPFKNSLAR